MFGRSFLKYKEETVGKFNETEDGDIFYTPRLDENGIPIEHSCPLGLYPVDKNKEGFEPDITYRPVTKDVLFWLSDRVFPENRENLQADLDKLQLSEYELISIIAKTGGFSFSDAYWITDKEDLRAPEQLKSSLYKFILPLPKQGEEDDEY